MQDRARSPIVLNMIVKDETEVLPRLLRSVHPYVGYYVIVDTGSSDGTQEMIQRVLTEQHGIAGEVHDRPWVSFGHNRNEALQLAVAANRGDWCLFVDADEELVVSDPGFFAQLEPGVSYDIRKRYSGTSYWLPQLVDIRDNQWSWEGPAHEFLKHQSGPRKRQKLDTVWIECTRGEGARSRSVSQHQKYMRDAKLFEEQLQRDPNDTRSQFYLGQSYKDAGEYDKAIIALERRAEMGGWAEEVFMARLYKARCVAAQKKPDGEILEAFLEAFECRPQRAEPLYELAQHYRHCKRFHLAYLFAARAAEIPRPEDVLFVSDAPYDWRVWDEIGISGYYAGRYREALEACRRVLEEPSLSEADRRRVEKNLQFSVHRLTQEGKGIPEPAQPGPRSARTKKKIKRK